jgi:ER lumen protein retaining receptor
MVFVCRYSDIFLYFVSYYNLVMKIAFLSLTAILIYFMRFKKPHCLTYDKESDNF